MAVIWYELILLPVYFGYTGSDGGVGILRFIILAIGTVLAYYAAKIATKVKITRVPWLRLIDTVFFFWGIALLTLFFPIENNTFTPLAIIILIINYSAIWFFYPIGNIIAQELF
ncbi:MAG: hypothetical protein ACFFDT_01380 [Candidatus Hodarchaeota archaeon]